ncbi:MAG: glycosyltransferase, partial [Lachnospiraceae bacterium]|nr:glycosyltransferase [Lachnospiraceae bacterium]
MHVAMLIGSLSKGGTERILVNLVDFLLKRGHQVTVVTQYAKVNEYELNRSAKRVISDITEAETGHGRLTNFYRRFRKLRSIWRAEKPDVILSFIGKNNLMALLTTRRLSIPVAVAVRGAPEAEYPTGGLRRAASFLYRYAEGVVM